MDNLYLESFFFAVPYRLLWSNWEQFNGANIPNTNSSTSFTIPQITASASTGFVANSLADYFGLPTAINSLTVDSLHFRAYNQIWNDWFRDENMQNQVTVDQGNGPDNIDNYVLLQRGKRYDYFTSCLPFAQKGTAVSLPLGTTAPIQGLGYYQGTQNAQSFNVVDTALGSTNYPWGYVATTTPSGVGQAALIFEVNQQAYTGQTPAIYADLSAATAATINALRLAFQQQKMYERDARGGTRYTEIIRSHFGVISPDARLQRAEYLGGGSTPISVNPVAQTSGSSISGETTHLGDLAAFATCATNGNGFVHSFTEHCILIGLVAVRADLNYQQGVNRMWNRQARFDFYWPAFSHIGEQAVLNREIYALGTTQDTGVFGYQEAWAEYRYKPGLITGEFRSNYSTPLDSWHLAQDFGSVPVLGNTFIVENAPMSRILAVSTAPHFLLDAWFSLHCARPMPVYSVPGLVDHF